jgi:ATP-dependent Clp protease adaptor protein ClpS
MGPDLLGRIDPFQMRSLLYIAKYVFSTGRGARRMQWSDSAVTRPFEYDLPSHDRPAGAVPIRAGVRRFGSKDGESPGGESGVIAKTKPKTQKPPLYKVLLLNDDYTPMEFVVHVLERFFGMSHAQAFELMLVVHKKGVAVVGVFSHEVAETKVAQVMDFARRHQHPLQCTMEKE